jgi:hypothetical protein
MAICLFVLAALSGLTVAALSMSRSDIVTSRNYRSASQDSRPRRPAWRTPSRSSIRSASSTCTPTWSTSGRGIRAVRRQPEPDAAEDLVLLQRPIAADPYHPADVNRAVLTATGTGSDNSLRSVKAFVIKSDIPNAPPARSIWRPTNNTNATFNGNNFGINGNDVELYQRAARNGGRRAGLTTRTETNAQEARNSLNTAQKNNVQGLGYIPATRDAEHLRGERPDDDADQPADHRPAGRAPVTNNSSHINGNQPSAPKPRRRSRTSTTGRGVTFGNGNVSGSGI